MRDVVAADDLAYRLTVTSVIGAPDPLLLPGGERGAGAITQLCHCERWGGSVRPRFDLGEDGFKRENPRR